MFSLQNYLVLHVLSLVWEMDHRDNICETNSLKVFNLLSTSGDNAFCLHVATLLLIQNMLRRD